MIHRLTNGVTTLTVTAPPGSARATVQTAPAGVYREITARGVPRVLTLYRRAGWVDPDELALHRARVSGDTPTLDLGRSARALPDLTAALLRQVVTEAGTVAAAAAALGYHRVALQRVLRSLPALRAELTSTVRPGGWRPAHDARALERCRACRGLPPAPGRRRRRCPTCPPDPVADAPEKSTPHPK